MKKSMIATAVVATAGLAASANAGYFTIQSAAVSGQSATNLTTPTGSYSPGNSSAAFNLELNGASASDAGAASYTGTAGTVYTSLTNTNATSIASAIGLSGNGTMAYFGYEDGAAGPGYFGIAFIGNGSTIDFNMGQANFALAGVHTNLTGSQFVGNTWIDSVSTTAGQAYVAIFANTQVGSQMGAGSVSDTSFNVRYLDFDGTSWNTVGSANSVASSSLNFATYNVPVPAPALLAGAGLVGAAALRRRMAKKA